QFLSVAPRLTRIPLALLTTGAYLTAPAYLCAVSAKPRSSKMAEIQAVKDPVPDPKVGKQRPKSGVTFPYYNLAQSIEVAKVMYEQAGGVCDRSQLAAMLKYKGTNNGGFLSRVSAAKMFGLIEPTADG